MDEFQDQPDDERAQEEAKAAQKAALESLIAWRLRDAIGAKENSGIEDIWLEDEDQYNGYDALNLPLFGSRQVKDSSSNKEVSSGRSTVFLNITKPKTDTAVSRVTEMLLPHDDKPWEIAPTPIAELQKAIDQEDQRPVTTADGQQMPAMDVAKAMQAEAQRSAELMTEQFEDWFVEGSAYSEMRKVIRDAGRIGSGVLKGPSPCSRKDKKWSTANGVTTLQIKERLVPHSRRIDPWDLYPDPSCGEDIHQGGYIFERDYLTGRRLRELARLPEYDTDAIAEILKEGPRRRARADRYMREKEGETQAFETSTFEVWYYYGDIPPEQIIAGGFKVAGLTDGDPEQMADQIDKALQLVTVPVVVTMVNERMVRMSLNPLETGEFPFDILPWEPVDGQPWGRGIPRKMAVAQRGLNAAVRAMMENAGMSAGPQIVVTKGAITPADGKYAITGRKLWFFTPTDELKDVRMAFASVMIDSAQKQLMEIIEFYLRMGDELSNLPLLLQGAVGSAPDTVGGMAMLQQNAASPLKAIAKQADDFLFVPHLKRYYAWAMQDPEVAEEAKGDLQCKARGSTILVARDQAAQFLPQLLPISKDPAFGLDPKRVATEVVRANKINPTTVSYTEEEAAALAEQAQNQPPDPRIAAAQIAAETKKMEVDQRAKDADLNRQSAQAIKSIELEIQAMEFAGQREISVESVKAMLTKAAIDARTKQDMQDREMTFAMTAGKGRGL